MGLTDEPEPFDQLAADLGADDLLVFARVGQRVELVGGAGRGAGWADIVSTQLAAEPYLARAARRGTPVRVAGSVPRRIVGPYWAAHAIIVPVSGEYLVVVGSRQPIDASDGEAVAAAARAVGIRGPISPAKLLADELEVVHAVRSIMTERGLGLSETVEHIAETAAAALSCELGAVLIARDGREVLGLVRRGWSGVEDGPELRAGLASIQARARTQPILEQDLTELADEALGAAAGLVARFAVPIGSPAFGVLVVAHAASRPRGFTTLCQRIGRAIADAAELQIDQASTRDLLANERDRYEREARTDALTGLANRAAWERTLDAEDGRRARYGRTAAIVVADVDGLKGVNDALGHEAGDRVLQAAAEILRSCSRGVDVVARLGGDEFAVLLPETHIAGARAYIDRVSKLAGRWSEPGSDLSLQLSLGAAEVKAGEDLRSTMRRADARMYQARSGRRVR